MKVLRPEGQGPVVQNGGVYVFRVWRRKWTNDERDRRLKYSVKDDKERVVFKKEVVGLRIKCWKWLRMWLLEVTRDS